MKLNWLFSVCTVYLQALYPDLLPGNTAPFSGEELTRGYKHFNPGTVGRHLVKIEIHPKIAVFPPHMHSTFSQLFKNGRGITAYLTTACV